MSKGEWIEWNGGECPVKDNVTVQVKFRNGGINGRERAGDWRWDHAIPGDKGLVAEYDIIAYRISSVVTE